MSLPVNQVITGDCSEIMRTWPSDSIDLVVTSPPYWGLRDYGSETVRVWGGDHECEHEWNPQVSSFNKQGGEGKQSTNLGTLRGEDQKSDFCSTCGAWRGSLGLEPHPQLFIDHLVEICHEIRRVLKPSGTFWINLGDTYYGSGKGAGSPVENAKEVYVMDKSSVPKQNHRSNWLQPKQKLMMPARVAIALQHDGWILRSDIIWHKPNHMPSSVKDRLTNAYEHVFLFAKARRYYFDLDAIRIPHQGIASGNKERKYLADPRQFGKEHYGRSIPWEPTVKGKNPGDVWRIPTKYSSQEQERMLRHGFYRGKEFDTVIVRPKLPSKEALSIYLKERKKTSGLTVKQIAEKLKLSSELVAHWFRTDEFFNYPSPDEWKKLSDILSLDRYYDEMTYVEEVSAYSEIHPRGKNPGDLWRIPTTPFPGAHFATFPPKLITPIIKAGSPKGGIVLDPFGGSGTVGQVARRLGRRFILIEIVPEYCKMAEQRVRGRYKPTPTGVVPLDQIMEAEK